MLAASASPIRTLKNRRWYERRRTGDVELSHFQLPVRYDAHGSGPERERAYGRLSSSRMTVLTGMERQTSWERMNISVSLTDTAWLLVAHLLELFYSLTKPGGRHKIPSISTPSLPMHYASWNRIPGIIHCETYESCCIVSDLICRLRLPISGALWTPRTSCARQDWLSTRLSADCLCTSLGSAL